MPRLSFPQDHDQLLSPVATDPVQLVRCVGPIANWRTALLYQPWERLVASLVLEMGEIGSFADVNLEVLKLNIDPHVQAARVADEANLAAYYAAKRSHARALFLRGRFRDAAKLRGPRILIPHLQQSLVSARMSRAFNARNTDDFWFWIISHNQLAEDSLPIIESQRLFVRDGKWLRVQPVALTSYVREKAHLQTA